MENQDDRLLGGKVQRISHYKAELSLADVNVLYGILLLRISKGYSPNEVSFLMGLDSDPMGRFERLARKKITIGMLMGILSALGEKSLGSIILFSSDVATDDCLCHMVRTKRRKIIEHALYLLDSTGAERLVFKLFERNPDHIQFPQSEIKKWDEIGKILDVELNDNWPVAKEPIEIYQHCCLLTELDIMPRHVMKVLGEMTSRSSYPKLLLNKSIEGRKITYEKVSS